MRRSYRPAVTEVWLRLAKLLFVTAAWAMVSACSSPCDNALVSTLPSPDGQLKAVVFTRDCGATVRTLTGVSVLSASAPAPDGWANALTIGDDPGHPIDRTGPAIDVHLKWSSNRFLSISFPRAALAQKRVTSVDGVTVSYETF